MREIRNPKSEIQNKFETRKRRRAFRSCALLLLSVIFPALGPAVTIVRDGQPKAVVIMAPQPDEFETRALNELTSNIEKISGAKLERATVTPEQLTAFVGEAKGKGQAPILIGRIAPPIQTRNVADRGAFVL